MKMMFKHETKSKRINQKKMNEKKTEMKIEEGGGTERKMQKQNCNFFSEEIMKNVLRLFIVIISGSAT